MAQARRGQRQQPPPADDDDDDDDAPITRAEVGQMINGAITGAFKRKLGPAIEAAVAGPIGELRSLIESDRAGRGDDPDDEPAEPARRGARGQRREAEPDQEPARRRARREDSESVALKQRLDKLEGERKTEREQAAARERDDKLRDIAKDLGVDPNRMRGAVAVLRESTRQDSKTGEWFFVTKGDAGEEEHDLEVGARAWGATDEGKAYLAPPAPAQGAGRGGTGTRQATVQSPAAGAPARGPRRVIGAPAGSPAPAGAAQGADPARTQRVAAAQAQLGDALDSLAGGSLRIG